MWARRAASGAVGRCRSGCVKARDAGAERRTASAVARRLPSPDTVGRTGWKGLLCARRTLFRVVLTLDMIMRSIAVEVNGEELEPLDTLAALPRRTASYSICAPRQTASMKETTKPEKSGAVHRILSTAAAQFALSGYHGASTREIASVAGVNEVTIYRHYPRKRDLYLAVLESELAKVSLRGDLLAHIAEARDGRTVLSRTLN